MRYQAHIDQDQTLECKDKISRKTDAVELVCFAEVLAEGPEKSNQSHVTCITVCKVIISQIQMYIGLK